MFTPGNVYWQTGWVQLYVLSGMEGESLQFLYDMDIVRCDLNNQQRDLVALCIKAFYCGVLQILLFSTVTFISLHFTFIYKLGKVRWIYDKRL